MNSDTVHLEASNCDPEHFVNCQMNLVASADELTVSWLIPDRLFRSDLLNGILCELVKELQERVETRKARG